MDYKINIMLVSIFSFHAVFTDGVKPTGRNLQTTYSDGKYLDTVSLLLSIKSLKENCKTAEECNTYITVNDGQSKDVIAKTETIKGSDSPNFKTKLIVPKDKIQSEHLLLKVFNEDKPDSLEFHGFTEIPKSKLFSRDEPSVFNVVAKANDKKPVEVTVTRFFKTSFNIHVVHQPGIGQENPKHELYIKYATKVKDGEYGESRKVEPSTPFPRFTFNIDAEDYAPDLDQSLFIQIYTKKDEKLGEITIPLTDVIKE